MRKLNKSVRKLPEYKFTPAGFENLKQELAKLLERRPGVLTRLVAAREQGDLSENAGYHAAKEELGKIDSRVRMIKFMMRLAVVEEAKETDVVAFGNKVLINSGGNEMEFTIVSGQEADPLKGKISDSSPIGSALIGKRVGDEVEVNLPGGVTTYKIIGIKTVS
ncbi:MAG: transcription elongation factor GreA [Candidatus Paceibacterales bacterium]